MPESALGEEKTVHTEKNSTNSETSLQALSGYSYSVRSLHTSEPRAFSLCTLLMCLRPPNTILGDIWALSKVFAVENVVVIAQERQSETFYQHLQ